MKLIFSNTGEEVVAGELVHDFRGDAQRVISIETPRHAGSTGRVYLADPDSDSAIPRGYYPSVIGAEWSNQRSLIAVTAYSGGIPIAGCTVTEEEVAGVIESYELAGFTVRTRDV